MIEVEQPAEPLVPLHPIYHLRPGTAPRHSTAGAFS